MNFRQVYFSLNIFFVLESISALSSSWLVTKDNKLLNLKCTYFIPVLFSSRSCYMKSDGIKNIFFSHSLFFFFFNLKLDDVTKGCQKEIADVGNRICAFVKGNLSLRLTFYKVFISFCSLLGTLLCSIALLFDRPFV